ncbi:MAG: hypothetical protein HFE30_01945 [Clostridiales bacterium]|nr:hypothetical protein [Clostridiales bacterium]
MNNIEYRVADARWKMSAGFGNHRFIVSAPKSEYVRVTLPWRRRDLNPEKIGVRIRYTPSEVQSSDPIGSVEIDDIIIESVSREEGSIIFRAPESGNYEIYYMPYQMPGPWYSPTIIYIPPTGLLTDEAWKAEAKNTDIASGEVLRYEARTEFDSFYPMEIPMTKAESESFLSLDAPFRTVTESRLRSVRMFAELPAIWFDRSETETRSLSDTVCSNEHYAFQIAVCAKKALDNISVRFTDESGEELPLDSCICFNFDGRDADGKIIKIRRDMHEGEVLPLWCGVRVENFDKKKIKIFAEVSAENTDFKATSEITLYVTADKLPRNGDDDLWRMSRLFWLNSDIGINNDVIAPYTPVVGNSYEKTISILGRKIEVGALGLPSKITSFYDDACLISDKTEPMELLYAPMTIDITENGENVSVKESRPAEWIEKGTMETDVVSFAESGGLELESETCFEAEGHINCTVKITAKNDGEYSFELKAPMRDAAAPYMMGMCHEGGRVPSQWDYKWNTTYHGNTVWFGGARVGMQIKLMQEEECWAGTDPLPKLWHNDGLGGMHVSHNINTASVDFNAWTGKVKMSAGQTEILHFHLIVTPFHPVDYDAHWTEHYYHKNSWHSTEPIPSLENAVKNGTKTVILHQGGPLNENINYPFHLAPKLKEEIDRAHEMGLKYKIYYTVRELSNYTTEIWALRALGDEIFYMGDDYSIADFFVQGNKKSSRSAGGPWLIEHLVEGYTPAWHQYLQNGEYDCAIKTQNKSRWHNYYLAGLDWLCRVVGIDGLYLDGIGYDRHIMKRVRRVIENARGDCDIDIHCANEHSPAYTYVTPACKYLEHYAYANNLWNGEGYDYYSESPDFYFTEVSGLPFGMMGEMLEGGGNPYRGMLYGMTTRCGWSQGGISRPIWDIWDDFDMTRCRMLGYWNPECPVNTESDLVKTTVYLRDDGEILLAVASWCMSKYHTWRITLNCEQLGIDGDYEFYAPPIEGMQEEATFKSDELIPMEFGKGYIFRIRKI